MSAMQCRRSLFRVAMDRGWRCGPEEKPTHLVLTNGKYRVPAGDDALFKKEYTMALQAGERLALCEVRTEVAPFYVDLDIKHSTADPLMDDVEQFIGTICETVASTVNFEVAESSGGRFDPASLGAGGCVVLASKPCPAKHKQGIHIVWPNIKVSRETAIRLRAMVTTALFESYPNDYDWNDVVDAAVYRPGSSLRMPFSFKAISCPECLMAHSRGKGELDAALQEAREYIQAHMVQKAAKLVGGYGERQILALLSNADKALDWHKKKRPDPSRLQGLREGLLKAQRGGRCGNRSCTGKAPDTEMGCYTPIRYMDGDGAALPGPREDGQDADPYYEVLFSSIRSPGAEEVALTLPKSISAPKVDIRRVGADGEVVRVISAGPPPDFYASSLVKVDIDRQVVNDIRGDLQDWLRSHPALSSAYGGIQVKTAYKLHKKEDSYSVVLVLHGPNSRWCKMSGKEHTSNHVYVEIREDRSAALKCFSCKLPACKSKKGVALSGPVPHRPFAVLFPYCQAVLDVMDEEVADWLSGRTPDSYLAQYRLFKCTREDNGAAFRMLIHKSRVRQNRHRKLDRGTKRGREEQGSRSDAENDENDCDYMNVCRDF